MKIKRTTFGVSGDPQIFKIRRDTGERLKLLEIAFAFLSRASTEG